MAYDISGMAAYSKSEGKILIADLLLKGQSFTQEGIAVQEGIKSTDKMVDFSIDSNTFLQATSGDPGALSYSGGSTLLDVDISVVEVAAKERYTTNTLNAKITQMQLRAGSDPGNPLPYSDVLVDLKSRAIGTINDVALWQGNTATGNTNGNTNKFDGWQKLIAAGAAVTGGSSAAFTAATVVATVEAFVKAAHAAFPAWVNEGSYLYMSPTQFSTYYRAVYGLASVIDNQSLNAGGPVESFYVPGTKVLVMATQGLTSQNNIYQTRFGNLVIGTDLVSEDDSLSLEYLNEAMIWRLFAIYKLGAQVARVAEVVGSF